MEDEFLKIKDFRAHGDISPARKAMYYGGMALIAIGALLFIAPFFTIFSFLEGPSSTLWEHEPLHIGGSFRWAFVGMLLMIAGNLLRSAGDRGLAGSGLILDPKRAGKELAPYSEAVGGMVHDAVSSYRKQDGQAEQAAPTKVMIRCRNCRALNDENANFCAQCGQAI